MTLFEDSRPRTSRAEARQRERRLQKKLEQLLQAGDEETFVAGLKEDFGIAPEHPKFKEMLTIWRGSK